MRLSPRRSVCWEDRQAALERTAAFAAGGERLTPDEILFVERMLSEGHRLSWIATGSNGADEVGTLPTNDFAWHTSGIRADPYSEEIEVEHKALGPGTPVDAKHIARQIAKATSKNKRRLIVRNVVVDVGDRDVPRDAIEELSRYNEIAERVVERLWLMSRGRLARVPLYEERGVSPVNTEAAPLTRNLSPGGQDRP